MTVHMEHETECSGHHCLSCGLCLCYDPDDELFRMEGETDEQDHTCEDCRREQGEVPFGLE